VRRWKWIKERGGESDVRLGSADYFFNALQIPVAFGAYNAHCDSLDLLVALDSNVKTRRTPRVREA
jgi:hypothetical protein